MAAGLVIILTLWAGWHLLSAQLLKNNPPAECVLVGGTWNIWDGWSCN